MMTTFRILCGTLALCALLLLISMQRGAMLEQRRCAPFGLRQHGSCRCRHRLLNAALALLLGVGSAQGRGHECRSAGLQAEDERGQGP